MTQPTSPLSTHSFISMTSENESTLTEEIKLLQELATPFGCVEVEFENLTDDETELVFNWLLFLQDFPDMENPRTKSLFAFKILKILELAASDGDFFKILKDRLCDIFDSCQDGSANILNEMEIERLIFLSKGMNLEEIFPLFKQAFCLKIIEEVSTEISLLRSPIGDAREISLALQNYFQEKYSLPICTQSMFFKNVHKLKRDDFTYVKTKIDAGLSNLTQFSEFMLSTKVWRERLTNLFEAELLLLQESFFKKFAEFEDRKETLQGFDYLQRCKILYVSNMRAK